MQYANILTGGIGCGKSTVAKLLELEGFIVINADSIAHHILEREQQNIVQQFGTEILHNNKIDRQKLGIIVFNDSKKKQILESLLHPLIHAEILQQCKKLDSKQKPYFVEIPLYFESKYHYPSRFVICVYAPQSLQLQRIMQRNNLSAQEAQKRIESQIDIESKKAKSNFVIENTGDLKALQHNLNNFLTHFKSLFS